ncbi:hypothetical protein HAT2_00329 [Candidatus Similichlamydia laticola]|uniref:Uncharacterized protein n=2 Tax=Candidatus Similichlamydia laticola TaxID=2170265 RepID=A0A369KIG9_9BACT|nr:hypothetical protein HAT2_00329 [Candidatus Similichlamydia laticola]
MRHLIDLVSPSGVESLLLMYHWARFDTVACARSEGLSTVPAPSRGYCPEEGRRYSSDLEIKRLLAQERGEQDHIDFWKEREQLVRTSRRAVAFFKRACFFVQVPCQIVPFSEKTSLMKKVSGQISHRIPLLSQKKPKPLFLRSIYQLRHVEDRKEWKDTRKTRCKKKKETAFTHLKEPIPQISFFVPLNLLEKNTGKKKKFKRLKKLKRIFREEEEKEAEE